MADVILGVVVNASSSINEEEKIVLLAILKQKLGVTNYMQADDPDTFHSKPNVVAFIQKPILSYVDWALHNHVRVMRLQSGPEGYYWEEITEIRLVASKYPV